MARAPDERAEKAHEMFKQGMKLIEIANQLNLPPGTVRRWKSTYKWGNERSDKNNERSDRKKGGQPGNKNAVDGGAPVRNKNAEKYGFLTKYLPPETLEIFEETKRADPLDLLWHQIQIAYAAIVRAQRIAYVKDQQDKTINKIGQKDGDTVTEERWEVQEAWDKQENFLKAQARAQGELRSMIKQYDDMLHKNWDMVTDEQKARIALLKAKVDDPTDNDDVDDGFLDALNGSAKEDWSDEED